MGVLKKRGLTHGSARHDFLLTQCHIDTAITNLMRHMSSLEVIPQYTTLYPICQVGMDGLEPS